MTFSLHAFSSSDTTFDIQAAALEDPRLHPTEAAVVQLGHAIMTELLDLVADTALEDVQTILAESLIGAFHSAAGRIEREADRARDRMRILARDFDGSELADTELQDATRATRSADVAQAAAELIRDAAAEVYGTVTGEVWTAWRGSRRGTRLTAAQLEAKQAIRALERRRASEAAPEGRVVAFRAAPFADSETDGHRIFDALNWARSQWPDMALATTGARGAERLAIRWAQQKGGDPRARQSRLRPPRQSCAVPRQRRTHGSGAYVLPDARPDARRRTGQGLASIRPRPEPGAASADARRPPRGDPGQGRLDQESQF